MRKLWARQAINPAKKTSPIGMFESVIGVAFFWGLLSALSLPVGALIGLTFQPKEKTNSAFMAYGAGALLFALTVELFGHVPHHVEKHGLLAYVVVVCGALGGGLLFDMMNKILNDRGAFLRKLSSARKYVAHLKRKRARELLEGLSKIKALEKLPPAKMARLIQFVDQVEFMAGEPIFKQGDEATDMYFIISGEIEIILHGSKTQTKKITTFGPGETFGEMGILLGVPRTADAIPLENVRLYKLSKLDFDETSRGLPELKKELGILAHQRLNERSVKNPEETDKEWRSRTLDYLYQDQPAVTMDDLKKEGEHIGGSSAALAIWMGILIDGIPESLIIGILALKPGGMSLAFIAGVFIANLPEAMGSAVSMQKGGMKYKKILMMWSSLCIMTGIGAALGALLFPANPHGITLYLVLGIEGIAAGAMLTMIAETMLPEAFQQGGSIVGMFTLLGFLSALSVKVLV